MKNGTIALLTLAILFTGCKPKPSPWNSSTILAKKNLCKTCRVDIR